MSAGNYLIISDLQIPFEHNDALKFCFHLKHHYKIPDENILNVGDELDQYWGGLWDKSPEAAHTANQEIKISLDKLHEWYCKFPEMKLCLSNHGSRWIRKAFAAQIPSQLLRCYRDVIQAPEGWRWQKHWKIKSKLPFIIEHGDDWGGQFPHVTAAIHNGMSTAMGHHHTKLGVEYIKTNGLDVWGAIAGSLIDFDQYAFEYARNAKLKPQVSVLLVVNDGKTVIPLRM